VIISRGEEIFVTPAKGLLWGMKTLSDIKKFEKDCPY